MPNHKGAPALFNKDKPKVTPGFLVKADGETGRVTAVVNVFGVIDDGNDIVHPGAFAKTITEAGRRIKILDQHRTSSTRDVVAKLISAREIGRNELPGDILREFPEATGGLEAEMQFVLDDPDSKAVFSRISEGLVSEYSFGYEVLDSDVEKVTDPKSGLKRVVRNLRTIKLWEISPVVWGMNPATATTGVKEVDENGRSTRRLGDTLIGKLFSTYSNTINGWLVDGFIDGADHAKLLTLMTQASATITAGMEPDLHLRAMPGFSFDDFWLWMENDPDSISKMASHIRDGVKAGRVLSATNINHLRSAFNELETVLANAGVLGNEAAEPETETTAPDSDDPAGAVADVDATPAGGAAEPGSDSPAAEAAAHPDPVAETASQAGPETQASAPPTSASARTVTFDDVQRKRQLMLAQIAEFELDIEGV